MTRCRRNGASAILEGRFLQRPGSRKRLPSKDFGVDDDQIKILAKLRELRCQRCKALLERLSWSSLGGQDCHDWRVLSGVASCGSMGLISKNIPQSRHGLPLAICAASSRLLARMNQ
jgi:hypothetical protein